MTATSTAQRTRRPGVPEIAYDDHGRGEAALLFLPGWCASREIFRSLPKRCGFRRRALSLDWRGHGESQASGGDFGMTQLALDAMEVIRSAGVRRVIPVALAHAGWVALELRRRLESMVQGIVLVDWLVLEAPRPFIDTLRALQCPERWQDARGRLLSSWTHGLGLDELERFIAQDMGSVGFEMWARAGREIERAYARFGSPLRAFAGIERPVPLLHLYAQPDDASFLRAQRSFAATYPWFQVHKLGARSHFPMFEVPDEMADAIERFAGTLTPPADRARPCNRPGRISAASVPTSGPSRPTAVPAETST